MSAFTVVSELGSHNTYGRMKAVVLSATGTASYDTGGSVIDLSTSGVLGTDGFTSVHGVHQIDCDTAASDKYDMKYLHGTTAANGLLKVRDLTAASVAEISAATDIHTTTFKFLVFGY